MSRAVSGALRGLRTTAAVIILAAATRAEAQVTPAAGYTPPDDTPSIRVGVTIFADYSVMTEPKGTDVDGNEFTPNSFNITRAYLNVTGNISHLVSFRVTPDIVRETGTTTSSTFGSYVYRLKYAYGQFNLDDWMQRGSWIRFGMQQTPWIDFIDNIYRYRFQGPTLEDREGILSSSDVGVTFHYNFAGNYGDAHGGFYNGENYNRPEVNEQKAFMVRGTVRPLPMHGILRGLRVTGFYDFDAYVQDAERRRGIVAVTFENPYVNAGVNGVWTKDQTRVINPELDSSGYSIWATPKTAKGHGFEGLFRFDHLEQGQATTVDGERNRTIAGVAYWFPRQGNVATALLLDYEQVDNDRYVNPVRPDEKRWAVHMYVNF
jgi:hypothetical protein